MAFTIDGTNGLTFNNATVQASAGVVLQIVNASYSTQNSTASTTYVITGLTANITPKFATSKILVLITLVGATGSTNTAQYAIHKNGTLLAFTSQITGGSSTIVSAGGSYLDSPTTTSAVTYAYYYLASTGTVYANYANSTSTITLMEIAA
jgi:hypothetical protein